MSRYKWWRKKKVSYRIPFHKVDMSIPPRAQMTTMITEQYIIPIEGNQMVTEVSLESSNLDGNRMAFLTTPLLDNEYMTHTLSMPVELNNNDIIYINNTPCYTAYDNMYVQSINLLRIDNTVRATIQGFRREE